MQQLEKRLIVGFRRREDWAGPLTRMLHELLAALKLTEDAEQEHVAKIVDSLAELVYAKQLRAMRLIWDDVVCRIDVKYDPGEDDEDDLDISLLNAVEWEQTSLTLELCVSDESYARYLGAERTLKQSSETLNVVLTELGAETEPQLHSERSDEAIDRQQGHERLSDVQPVEPWPEVNDESERVSGQTPNQKEKE